MRIKTEKKHTHLKEGEGAKIFYSRVTRLPVLSEGRRSRGVWKQTVELGTVFEKRLGGLVSQEN